MIQLKFILTQNESFGCVYSGNFELAKSSSVVYKKSVSNLSLPNTAGFLRVFLFSPVVILVDQLKMALSGSLEITD